MSTATLLPAFQDLTDGPGELGPMDEGKVPAWSWADRRLIMIPLPQPGAQQIIVRGGGGGGGSGEGGTTNHAALLNLDYASAGHTGFEPAGAGVAAVAAHVSESDPHTQYLLEADYTAGVSDHALLSNLDYASSGHTGFEAAGTATAAISTHVGESDPHTQYALESALGTMAAATETNYLRADGTRTGATSQAQTFTNGIQVGTARIAYDNLTSRPSIQMSNFELYNYITTTRYSRLYNNGLTITMPGTSLDYSDPNRTFTLTGIGAAIISKTSSSATARFQLQNSSAVVIGDWYTTPGDNGMHFNNLGSGGIPYIAFEIASVEKARHTATSHLFYSDTTDTNSVRNLMTINHKTSGTPAAGYGVGILSQLESSTTADQDVGRLTWEWVIATHASRASRGKLSAYYTSTEQTAMTWDGDTGGLKLAFYGGTPTAKAAAYTQSYSTADRTLAAYTADNESGAYSGIDNAQAGSVYATLTDLNALRTAYENLRAFVEDIAGVVNSHTDDLQALNLVG